MTALEITGNKKGWGTKVSETGSLLKKANCLHEMIEKATRYYNGNLDASLKAGINDNAKAWYQQRAHVMRQVIVRLTNYFNTVTAEIQL